MNSSYVNIKASMGGYGGSVKSAGTYEGNFCAIKATSGIAPATIRSRGSTLYRLSSNPWYI